MVDARPVLNAMANKAIGLGYEATGKSGKYTKCAMYFCSIPNIHNVSDARQRLERALCRILVADVKINSPLAPFEVTPKASTSSCLAAVAESPWYDLIVRILSSVSTIVSRINNKEAVIVHCSDGWDRTAQLTSLTMLCVDPYYRSCRGFAELIEREFVLMGHKFLTRNGLPSSKSVSSSQKSPIFLQYLDCVFQIILKNPTAFEFDPSYLLMFAEQHTNGVWSTFSADDDCSRNLVDLPPIWSVCLDEQLLKSRYIRQHTGSSDLCTLGGFLGCKPLEPGIDPWDVTVWWAFWGMRSSCALRWMRCDF